MRARRESAASALYPVELGDGASASLEHGRNAVGQLFAVERAAWVNRPCARIGIAMRAIWLICGRAAMWWAGRTPLRRSIGRGSCRRWMRLCCGWGRGEVSDLLNLQPLINAQAGGVLEAALVELKAGRKRGHWMWFIFPQSRRPGRSAMTEYYGISGAEEARAYLAHPLLGPRLRECVAAVRAWEGEWTAEEMLGAVDAMKWRPCLELFEGDGGGWVVACRS